MQIQDAHGQFQVQLAADGRSEHTRKQYARHLRAMIDWLTQNGRSLDIAAITPSTVAEFFSSDAARLSARGGTKRATSANAQRTSLRCFFRWAHESGLTPNNVARLLKRARCAPPPPRALHLDEQERLLNVLAKATGPEAARDRMLVELLLGTGIRIGSALALDIEDLDFDHCDMALRSTKGNRPTSIMMPPAIAKTLQQFVAGRASGPVFRAGGRRASTRHMQRRLAQWFAKAQITGRSAHGLRHTFATKLYAKTGDLQLVQQALTHASIASTLIYAKLDRARLRAAVGS
jgi:integrase/recombinase XerC